MSAFDDDDFQGNYVRVNDFADEDDDIADNWEDVLDEDEIEEKRKQAEKAEEERKEQEKQRKLQKRAEEKAEKERIAALLNAAPLSPEEILKRQVESSQSAANDLFGTDDADAPTTTAAVTASVQHLALSAAAADSVDNFVPVEPEDFTELCRRTALKLRNYNDDECYAKFVKELTLELCRDMVSEDIKKVSNALINVAHEKSRQEKEAKKKAQSTGKKSSLQVSKKAPTSSDLLDDYHDDQYGGGYYDDDIDFM